MLGHFAAVHESLVGPSRHVAPPGNLGRKRGIAEIDRPTSIAEGDARYPNRKFRLARTVRRTTRFCPYLYSDIRRDRTTAWPVRPGKFGWTMPTVEIESKSPSISKARVCSVFIHAGCQATSTLVTKRLSSRTRQWPE